MIKQWKAFNFKSVGNETTLSLAPLTIFAGANSSGKSTLLQTILLVAQTLSHKVSSRSVVLNGAFAKLGQFDDLRTAESNADQILIGWTCCPSNDLAESTVQDFRRISYYAPRNINRIAEISCEIAFDDKGAGADREITQIQPMLFSSQLSVLTRDSEVGDKKFEMTIRRASLISEDIKQKWIGRPDTDAPFARQGLQYDIEMDEALVAEIHEEFVSAQPIGCLLRHFLPERVSLGIDMVAEDARAIINGLTGEGPRGFSRRAYLGRQIVIPHQVVEKVAIILNQISDEDDSMPKTILKRLDEERSFFEQQPVFLEQLNESLRRFHPRIRMELRKRLAEDDSFEELVIKSVREGRNGSKEEPAIIQLRVPRPIAEASSYIDQFFATSVRYLGPLRDEPKSLYPLSPTADPLDIGIKGEHTAAVLELHKNRLIRYIPTSAFVKSEIDLKPTSRSLEKAVVDWLQYLGIADQVTSRDRGKFGHELTVAIDGSKRQNDLTHVGVGVSQVLPILVASLLAEPDTTLIFEQPELHLHPKVQTLLADLFLSMTQLGKQCIIETHSEYLINRIRFRAAAALKSNPWIDAVKVYFVEKENQHSYFREININEYGAILDWPKGFFDQSQSEAEAILSAAASKRKAKREKTP
ncbi:MAG: DUF3696 domain-containing protein [Sedimentisphaerales bacterium]|nr:DUF3696 domain-containing protein [Sedimentisphaerales bacterium]